MPLYRTLLLTIEATAEIPYEQDNQHRASQTRGGVTCVTQSTHQTLDMDETCLLQARAQ